jgi:hypothetical protein
MSDPVIISIVTGSQAIVLAIITYLQNKNHRENLVATEVVRKDVNSKMTEMNRVIAEAALAKGKLEGRAEQKKENESGRV